MKIAFIGGGSVQWTTKLVIDMVVNRSPDDGDVGDGLAGATLAANPELFDGVKVDPSALSYHPDAYMINGSGGYGFVLAPYLAARLRDHLVDDTPFDAALSPVRFIYRYAKKEGKRC